MIKNNHVYWYLCIIIALILSVLSFTPLVIPNGIYEPLIGNIPRTMWVGILIYICLVIITYIGTRVHPKNERVEGEKE
jgi:hypothetical protein